MSRHLRRDRRSTKHLDTGSRRLATMPWKTAAAFEQMESILDKMQCTGDIDAEKGEAIFQVPTSHEWFELAPSIEGFARVFELHAHISYREMPTAPLRQLAKKFEYGMMIFQSDVDLVRESLSVLKYEAKLMTLNYATALIQTFQEDA